MNGRRNVPEIVIGIKRITSRDPNSDQSPLYDVKNHARVSRRTQHAKRCFADDFLGSSASLRESTSAIKPSGGARRDRTDDLMLAKHALSQLSYGPVPEDECFWLTQFEGLPSRSSRCARPAFALWASAWQPSLAARAKAGGPGKT